MPEMTYGRKNCNFAFYSWLYPGRHSCHRSDVGGPIPQVAALGLGALTLANVLGIVAGNTFFPRIYHQCDPGIIVAKQKLLRLGIIRYGFRLTFQQLDRYRHQRRDH